MALSTPDRPSIALTSWLRAVLVRGAVGDTSSACGSGLWSSDVSSPDNPVCSPNTTNASSRRTKVTSSTLSHVPSSRCRASACSRSSSPSSMTDICPGRSRSGISGLKLSSVSSMAPGSASEIATTSHTMPVARGLAINFCQLLVAAERCCERQAAIRLHPSLVCRADELIVPSRQQDALLVA